MKNKAREAKTKAKSDASESHLVITMDPQSVLLSPKTEASTMSLDEGIYKKASDLSLRKPEPMSLARNINMSFDNLERIQLKYNCTSAKIINVDESGIITVLAVPKGCKQVSQTVSGERGKQVTLVGMDTASG
ncbi:hypothetical protein ILUMI_24032 [Ignelater luminosus]|uniref:Uncharacterized protein n=1 Tax=Ignelater luminosus TaxID=2038154 RepID=A0A8K0G124_IGNLU|nr:hypothetical protein ILUMI_24032 [Ignelater luminosus]